MTARRLPLRGADLVLVAMQSLFKAASVSNNTTMVVHCDGPIAPGRIERALDRFLGLCPWPAARLRRPRPWGALHWSAGPRAALVAPPVRHCSLASDEELHRVLEDELNAAIDPRRQAPVRVLTADVARDGTVTGSVLAVTWFHPLMDPRGGQNFLTHLARLDDEGGHAAGNGASATFVPPRDPRPLRERGRLARQSLEHMRSLLPVSPVSPGTGLDRPGGVRFRQATFVDRDPIAERSTRDISGRLALVGAAMADLWRRRDLPDIPFLVPVSVDLRPKGDSGATFGNQLAFHFARFKPSETADVAALASALRRQMTDAVRDGRIEANAVAMEFLKYRPVAMMLRDLPGSRAGETFSFNCADITDFPSTLPSVFGRRVVNAYHVPAVLPRPGLGVFFNRCASTHNLVVSWIEGAVSEDDVARIVEIIREGLGWARPA